LNDLDDAVASIACYLKKNVWKSNADRNHQMKIIKKYNRSNYYAECILDLAKEIGGWDEGKH